MPQEISLLFGRLYPDFQPHLAQCLVRIEYRGLQLRSSCADPFLITTFLQVRHELAAIVELMTRIAHEFSRFIMEATMPPFKNRT